MPVQKPGKSKQDYCTPDDFIQAVYKKLGIDHFVHDFAADATNTKARTFFSEQDSAFDYEPHTWARLTEHGWGWLNPPFARIEPWVKHASQVPAWGGNIAVLVPAGVGSNWFYRWVHNKATVLALNGRLAFMPDKPDWLYPKDCLLLLYGYYRDNFFDVWRWKA